MTRPTIPQDAYATAERIAGHVRASRVRRGLSLTQLARIAGVSFSTVQAFETARKPIFAKRGKVYGYSEATLNRMEQALGWGWGSFLDLVEGKVDQPWVVPAGEESQAYGSERVPDVITLDWLVGMILRYKMQPTMNGES